MSRFSLNTLKSAIQSPARSHLFRCLITPAGLISTPLTIFTEAFQDDNRMYLCKMATLPEMTIETGEVYYFTRAIKYPVRRRYTPVTLTFFNTTDYTLRNAFEKWSEVLLNPSQNVGFWELGDKQRSVDGTATVKITHYGQDYSPTNLTHNSLREYTFFHAYPSSIGPLTFSYDNDTEIQTFDVTLEYSYFVGDAITSATVTTSTGFPEEGDAGDTQGGITED